MATHDLHPEPFETLVVLGESTVEGGGWLMKDEPRWADVLAGLIDACQEKPIAYHNEGIGASVISPRSPGYADSRKPSALERYHERVIARRPDLFVMAYGLNDMRAGMDVREFVEDMQTIVHDVKAACDPVIVLATVYHMTGFGWYAPFDKGGREATLTYNEAIAQLASENGCLLADIWSAQGEADWLVHQDGVHANAVGSLLIANRVFETIAAHCGGLSAKTNARHADTEWARVAAAMRSSSIEPAEEPR